MDPDSLLNVINKTVGTEEGRKKTKTEKKRTQRQFVPVLNQASRCEDVRGKVVQNYAFLSASLD
jgi:hypothetical protein